MGFSFWQQNHLWLEWARCGYLWILLGHPVLPSFSPAINQVIDHSVCHILPGYANLYSWFVVRFVVWSCTSPHMLLNIAYVQHFISWNKMFPCNLGLSEVHYYWPIMLRTKSYSARERPCTAAQYPVNSAVSLFSTPFSSRIFWGKSYIRGFSWIQECVGAQAESLSSAIGHCHKHHFLEISVNSTISSSEDGPHAWHNFGALLLECSTLDLVSAQSVFKRTLSFDSHRILLFSVL